MIDVEVIYDTANKTYSIMTINHKKSSCLTGGANSGGNHSDMDMLIIEPNVCRRYSVREAFRLQTVPEHHIDTLLNSGISNSQLYKMCGNGWTMLVIAHIFKSLKQYRRQSLE